MAKLELVEDPEILSQFGNDAPTLEPVDDPEILAQFEKAEEVTDPGILAQFGQEQEDQRRVPASEKLAATLQSSKLFGSATAAMGAGSSIGRKPDGSWDLPLMAESQENPFVQNIAALAVTAGQKLGARLDSAGMAVDKQAIRKVFDDFQQAEGLSDDEVIAAWDDLGIFNRKFEEGEKVRVTSQGQIVPNSLDSDWMDTGKATAIINSSAASPESKAAAFRNLPAIQEQIAKSKAEGYAEASRSGVFGAPGLNFEQIPLFTDFAKQHGGTSVEQVRAYEERYLNRRLGVQKQLSEWMAAGQAGMRKADQTIFGLTAMAADAMTDKARKARDEAAFKGEKVDPSRGLKAADYLRGEASRLADSSTKLKRGADVDGLISSLLEETPSLAVQIGLTRGFGAAGAALSGSARVAQTTGLLASFTAAGGQSAGVTYAQQIAAGDTPEEARKKAVKAGVNTAIITGVFSTLGLGGVENIAAGGAARMTLGNFLAFSKKKGIANVATSKEFRQFVGGVLKSAGGEASEEGIDELTAAFLTADPDENLADAWANAVKAAEVGGFIGGAVDVAAGITQDGEGRVQLAYDGEGMPAGGGTSDADWFAGERRRMDAEDLAESISRQLSSEAQFAAPAAAEASAEPIIVPVSGAAAPAAPGNFPVAPDAELNRKLVARGIAPPNPLLSRDERQAYLRENAPDLAAAAPAERTPEQIAAEGEEFLRNRKTAAEAAAAAPIAPLDRPADATPAIGSEPAAGSPSTAAAVPAAAPTTKYEPLPARERRQLFEDAEAAIDAKDPTAQIELKERFWRLKRRHDEARRELDEATTPGDRRRAELDMMDDENAIRRLVGMPEVETQAPITEEDQRKEAARQKAVLDELDAKIARGEPLTDEDRKAWVMEGRKKADIPTNETTPTPPGNSLQAALSSGLGIPGHINRITLRDGSTAQNFPGRAIQNGELLTLDGDFVEVSLIDRVEAPDGSTLWERNPATNEKTPPSPEPAAPPAAPAAETAAPAAPVPVAVTPQAGEPAAPAPLTYKKAKDFAETGNYDVETGRGVRKMFKDPESKDWHDESRTGSNFSHIASFIGFTRDEALARMEERYGRPEATAAEKPKAPKAKAPKATAPAAPAPEVDPVTGIEILPPERANEADIRLGISQGRNYFTLWFKQTIRDANGKTQTANYQYLTILSKDIDEARAKAAEYAKQIASGTKLPVAFFGRGLQGAGSAKSVAVGEDLIDPTQLEEIDRTPIADQPVGFGKYSNMLVKDILTEDPGYAEWLIGSGTSRRALDIAAYLKSRPEWMEMQDERELESERIKAYEQRRDARAAGEKVSVTTMVRKDGEIVEVDEDTAPPPKVKKLKSRKAKDQILDIVAPQETPNLVAKELVKHLYPMQLVGANAAIASMEKDGVFLNGDGAGVGKTRQIVAVANHYAKQGKRVFIISENAAIGKPWEKVSKKTGPKLAGSMSKDSEAMGVKLELLGEVEQQDGGIYVTNYSRVKAGDIPDGAVLIFDEAQNLANTFGSNPDPKNAAEREWEAKFKQMLPRATAVAYYSATPADKPHQLAYLHKILGYDTPGEYLAAAQENGMVLKTRKFGNKEVQYYDVPQGAKRKKLFDWVNQTMLDAGAEGRFIKREISYEGTDVQFQDLSGTDEGKNPWAKYFNDVLAQMKETENLGTGIRIMAPESYVLYAAELTKIGKAVEMAKKEIAAGRKAVVFFSRIKPMVMRYRRYTRDMNGEMQVSEPIEFGSIPSPVDLIKAELEKEGITFTELHGATRTTSQKAQKEFAEKVDVLLASLESGGTGINLDDTTGSNPRTEIFMFAPYRGTSTIQGMGRIWRASTIQDDNNPNRFAMIVASDIKPDVFRSAVLAKKLQLMGAAMGGTAVAKMPMSKTSYDPKQLAGLEMSEDGEESALTKPRTGKLKPVTVQWKPTQAGEYFSKASADLLEWEERGGPERTGLEIRVFKSRASGDWIALADRPYTAEEFALPEETEPTPPPAPPTAPAPEPTPPSTKRDVIKLRPTDPKVTAAAEAIREELGEPAFEDANSEVLTPEGVLIDVRAFGDNIILSNISTPEGSRGTGAASRAVDTILEGADRAGVPVKLIAKPFGDAGLSKKQLIAWYSAKGFELQPDGETMVRPPQQVAAPTPTPTPKPEPKAKSARPKPYSPAALKETFNLSEDQTVVTDALVRALGLDTSRLQLKRGGMPGDGSLEQSSARDAEYLAAVEAGDMAKAQTMVDQAARAAGYGVGKAFHGTRNKGFTTFKTGDLGHHFGLSIDQVFGESGRFSDTPKNQVRLIEAYLDIKNPLELTDRGSWSGWLTVREVNEKTGSTLPEESSTGADIQAAIKAAGYDGVLYENYHEGEEGSMAMIAFDPNQIKSADPVTRDADGNVIPLSRRFDTSSPSILYQDEVGVDSDPAGPVSEAKSRELEAGKKVRLFRAMQLIDGKLYPPMSAVVEGKLRTPTEVGVWERAEERPDLLDKDGKFVLRKGNGATVPAAYNPYFHASSSPLNDQFSSAYKRPNLVTVEVEVPQSELTSGYRAKGAKDAVGEVRWNSGPVSSKLPADRKRTVVLSRYAKVVRVVPDSEVADKIKGLLEGTSVEIPANTITPSLMEELQKRGVAVKGSPNILFQEADASTARFNELTADLYKGRSSATQKQIDVWRLKNPDKWAELSELRAEALRRAGYAIEANHGTTFEFTEFLREKANPDNDLGAGFYLSSNSEDSSVNYAGVGPDLTNRIERLAETISEGEEIPMARALRLARKQLVGKTERTINARVKFTNPVTLDGGGNGFQGTQIELMPDPEQYRAEAIEQLKSENSEITDDNLDEFDDEIQDRIYELQDADMAGDSPLETIRQVVESFEDTDWDKVSTELVDWGESIPAYRLDQMLRENAGTAYATDPDGESEPRTNELIRQVFEALGYDGIIDKTVYNKFGRGKGMTGVLPDTVHYIAFNSTQIKSVDPVSPGEKVLPNQWANDLNPNILYQRPQTAKGSFEYIKETGDILLRGLASPDFSTAVHEFAHVIRRTLIDRDIPAENRAGISDEDIRLTESWAGAVDGVWTVAAEEKFARAWERYLREGKSPVSVLQPLFNKMAAWLSEVYANIAGSPIDVEISPEMRAVFNRLASRNVDRDAEAEVEMEMDEGAPQMSDQEFADRVADVEKSVSEGQPPNIPPVTPPTPPPGVEEDPFADHVSNMHRFIDEGRARRGLAPLMKRPRVTNEDTWQAALSAERAHRAAGKPGTAGNELFAKLLLDPVRTLAPWETALLMHEHALRAGAHDAANYNLNALPAGSPLRDEYRATVTREQEAYDALTTFLRAAGSAAGSSLQALKMVIDTRDFTLARVTNEWHAAANAMSDTPVKWTEADQKAAEAWYNKYEALKTREAELIAENEGYAALLKQLTEDVERAQAKAAAAARVPAVKAKIMGKLTPAANAARARIAARKAAKEGPPGPDILLQSGPPPEMIEDLQDYAILLAEKMVNGVFDLAKASQIIVSEFGENLSEFAEWIHTDAKRIYNETVESVSGEGAPTPQNIIDAIDVNEELTKKDVWDLARAHVIQGARGSDVLDKVHEGFNEIFPDLTRERVADLFTDYGRTSTPSAEEVPKALRRVKTLERIGRQIDDIKAKREPKVTGRTGDPLDPNDPIDKKILALEEERRSEFRALQEWMRENNVPFEDSERKLKTALGSVKRRMANDIAKIEQALTTGRARARRQPVNFENDPEYLDLQKRLEAKRAEYDEVFKTEPDRLQTMKDSASKSLDRYLQMLVTGNTAVAAKPPGPTDPELEELRALRNTFAKQVAEARRVRPTADEVAKKKRDATLASAEKTLAELERKITENDLAAKAKGEPRFKDDTEIKAVRAEIKTARETLRDMRKAAKPVKDPVQAKIDAVLKSLDRQIAEEAKMLADGVLQKAKGQPVSTPDIEVRRERLRQMRQNRRDLYEAQNPDEIEARALEVAKKDAQTAIERLGEAVVSGDVAVKRRDPAYTPDDELRALIKCRETLSDMVSEMRRALPVTPDQLAAREKRMLTAAEATLANLDAKLATGDLSVKPSKGAANVPASVAAVREKIKRASRQLDVRRREAAVGPYSEAALIQRRLGVLRKKLADRRRRIQTDDYSKKKVPLPPSSPEITQIEYELEKQDAIFYERRGQYMLRNAPKGRRAVQALKTVASGQKFLVLGGDWGTILRNVYDATTLTAANDLMLGIKKLAGRADPAAKSQLRRMITKGVRAAFSPKFESETYRRQTTRANASWDSVLGNRIIAPYDKANRGSEDLPVSNLIDKVPWWVWPIVAGANIGLIYSSPLIAGIVGMSMTKGAFMLGASLVQKQWLQAVDRFQRTYVNEARVLLMDTFIDNYVGEMDVEDGRAFAHLVNVVTGRGGARKGRDGVLMTIERMMPGLNAGFLAPRYYLARILSLFAQPLWSGPMTPQTRKAIAYNYGKAKMVQGAILTLLIMAFGKANDDDPEDTGVVLNPYSRDFLKIRISPDVSVDVMAGFNQWMGFFIRRATGTVQDRETGLLKVMTPEEKGRDIRNFAGGKMNPLLRYSTETFFIGEYFGGKPVMPMTILQEATSMVVIDDMIKVQENTDPKTAAALSVLLLSGGNVKAGDWETEVAKWKPLRDIAEVRRLERESRLNK